MNGANGSLGLLSETQSGAHSENMNERKTTIQKSDVLAVKNPIEAGQ